MSARRGPAGPTEPTPPVPYQRPCRPRRDRPDDAAAVRRHHQMKDMEEANPEFSRTDVVLLVGANDVTNPAARRPGSSVSGMPILNVDEARSVIVIKRSMGHGHAGIDNELYTDPKTAMFGDAKVALTALVAGLDAYVN
ncbi:MAG: NAD(P)(+) transhydrogenase (Re/Si-specific) subunit beta [Dermatophilaceae bacterium]